MRFFEIADTNQQPVDPAVPTTNPPAAMKVAPKKVATTAPVAATKAAPATDAPPAIKKPAPKAAAAPVYADSKQLKDAIAFLQQQLPDGTFKPQNAKGVKRVASIRARGISLASLKAAMTAFGATMTNPTADQVTASSSFPANSFEKDGVLYTVVIGMKGVKSDDESSVGLSRKELTPTGLGLHGGIFDKNELINATKKAVDSKIRKRDPILADALIAMVDSAAAGGTSPIAPELMSHISPYLGTLAQDFGEILAPILVMKKGQKAELPTGNNPLVDVKIPGMNLSVKALTGSGTSFRSISDLMDKYESSITNDPERKKHFNVLKQFHPSAGGKNVDKIIMAAAAAGIPEYKAAVKRFDKFKNYDELFNQMRRWPWKEGTKAQYKNFLEQGLFVFTAASPSKYVGMPADGKFYLGGDNKGKTVKEKAAGYPSFKADPWKAAADIITYSLGVGLLNYVRGGKNAEQYKTMMTDIVNKADAVIGHITINNDGTMSLVTKPFSTLQFQFQYHAPSHIPGNNLPGFIAVLD